MPQILDLFARTFDEPLSRAVWDWRYLGRGFELLSWVAEEDGQILTFIGVRDQRVLWQGETHVAIDLGDLMTEPTNRGGGLLQGIAKRIKPEQLERESLFAYGFPSAYMTQLGLALLESELVGPVHSLVKAPLDPPLGLPGDLEPADEPAQDWDEHWARLETSHPVWLARDRDYLWWRYTRRPDRDYRFVISSMADAIAVVGVGGPTAYLMELIAPPGDAAMIGRLALAAEHAAAAAGAVELRAWFPEWWEGSEVLREVCGFQVEGPPHDLIVGDRTKGITIDEIRAGFFYSLGDWDVR